MFMDPLGSLGFGGDDAAQIAKKNKKGIGGAFDTISQQQDVGFGQAEQAYMQAIQKLQEGFGKAESAINRSGDASRQGVEDRAKSNLGAVSQSLSQSGLYNSSTRASAQMGVQGQADRQMQEIDQALSGMLGNLHSQSGVAQAQAYQGLSGMYGNQAQQKAGLGVAQANLQYGTGSAALPPQPSNPLGAIGGALGAFAGLYFGGPAGAAPGAAVGSSLFGWDPKAGW
jgi:hypothetical protein